LQAIEIYLHLVAQMRDEVKLLPDVVLLKNSFFYTRAMQEGYVYDNVKNWTRRMGDLLARDKILIPVNKDGNHWVRPFISYTF
jgi:Ulp1 family protease